MGKWRFHYQIADYAIALEGVDTRLESLAASLYGGARCGDTAPQLCFVLGAHADRFTLRCAGEELGVADSLNDFFQMVEWQLTEAFMRGLSAFYQLHAAVAVYRGSALILSGPSEAGKTSLLVGLTAAGALAYTDEIALFAAEDLRVHPFPRDLIIHRGTQQLFPETVADLPPWKIHSEYCFFRPLYLAGAVLLHLSRVVDWFFQNTGLACRCRYSSLVRPKRPVACWENRSVYGIGGRRALSWWGDWLKRVRPEN